MSKSDSDATTGRQGAPGVFVQYGGGGGATYANGGPSGGHTGPDPWKVIGGAYEPGSQTSWVLFANGERVRRDIYEGIIRSAKDV